MASNFVTNELPENPTAVALGVFDGVHRGHRAVLREAVSDGGLEPWVFTFSEKSLPTGKGGAKRLEPPMLKYSIMKKCGIVHVYAPDFGDMKDLSGEEFFKSVLIEHLKCRKAVCGADFRFGSRASCGAAEMRALCEKYGIECSIVEKVFDGDEAISSTRIRAAAESGDMETVSRLAGYPFCIEKEIVGGKHLGREFSLPTLNQLFDEGYIIPRFGVYVSAAYIDGKFYPAVTNVGVKPTVSNERIPGAETNVIGLSENLYGKTVFVFLLSYVREEMVFESREALFERIAFDRTNAEAGANQWIRDHGRETADILGI